MACQCAALRSARSPATRSTDRSHTSGAIMAIPSSVAFSTSASMRSLAGMPGANVTGQASSQSTGWYASTLALTVLRPISSTSACHWPPRPSNSVICAPGCSRSTCTWRLALGGSTSAAPGARIRSTWSRADMGMAGGWVGWAVVWTTAGAACGWAGGLVGRRAGAARVGGGTRWVRRAGLGSRQRVDGRVSPDRPGAAPARGRRHRPCPDAPARQIAAPAPAARPDHCIFRCPGSSCSP